MGQAFYRRTSMDSLAVAPRPLQPAARHKPEDLQQIRAGSPQAASGSDGLPDQTKWRRLGENLIKLAQVVETHLGLGERPQDRRDFHVPPQVAQQPVADAMVRDAAQLFFDPLQLGDRP